MTILPIALENELESCARLMSSTEPWVTLGRTCEASREILRDLEKEVFVVRVDEELAGFIILNMHGAFAGYIQTICLAPQFRNRGLGTDVISWAEKRIFERSPNVFMCVSSFNLGARRLYERLGYQVVGALTDYVVAGHDEFLLRKSLGSWSAFSRR